MARNRQPPYIGPAMDVPFLKMHGAGNDFVVLDERARPLGLSAGQVRRLADRRLGIGCDQLITLHPPPPHTDADVLMGIHNPDGSRAGACGNATRCVAELLFEETGHPFQVVRTAAGDLPAERLPDGRFRVDMGPVRTAWHEIPLAHEADTLHLPLPGDPAACSVGNPHATFFTDDVDAAVRDGARWEIHPIFPERANIGFARMDAPDRMRLRVWERGAGLTLACGSGACAAVANAHRRGLAGPHVAVTMDGGVLDIAVTPAGHMLMAGPAEHSFRGTVRL